VFEGAVEMVIRSWSWRWSWSGSRRDFFGSRSRSWSRKAF
jgi:hypothetical protein